MIDSYKNIERLRYRINKDLQKLYEKIRQNTASQMEEYVKDSFSALIAGIAGLFITQRTFDSFKNFFIKCISKFIVDNCKLQNSIADFITILVSILVLCIVAFLLNKAIVAICKMRKHSKGEGPDPTDYVKEFDNIACDSILAAIEYKELYMDKKNGNEKNLYYIEIVHYLTVACEITARLMENPKNIRSDFNVYGVDGYRIHNIKEIMDELSTFLKAHIKTLSISLADKKEIDDQLKKIDTILQQI